MEDLNIDNYSVKELMNILEIKDLDAKTITNKITAIKEKFIEENNDDMAGFFDDVKVKLLEAAKEKIVDRWYQNEHLAQEHSPDQNQKITSRQNKIQEFDGALKREQLGVNQSYNLPYVQGTLNPNLKNSTSKIISIDSRFRSNLKLTENNEPIQPSILNSSQFTLDLNEQLNYVTSLQLHSVQIPCTWYNIEEGSNSFFIDDNIITITPGNYTPSTLVTELNNKTNNTITFNYSVSTGKISITSTQQENIVFYVSGNINTPLINDTLGWLLGFRQLSYTLDVNTVLTGECVLDLNGPKYLLLYLDDFNNNRTNNGLVTIHDTETKLDLPKYYKNGNLEGQEVVKPTCNNDNPVPVPFFTQDLPRTITQAQQYSLNEIVKNRKNDPNIKLTSPNPNNILGLIPIKNINFGSILSESSDTLVNNVRNYFGPVDIERFEVKLLDDKGNLVNLNGNDWSFSLISKQLYQY